MGTLVPFSQEEAMGPHGRFPSGAALTIVGGCAVVVLLTVGLLVHEHLTAGFDHSGIGWFGTTRGSWSAQLATGFTTLGDAAPLLTILILAGVVVPLHWGGGWRLLMLPSLSASLAFCLSSALKHLTARARPPQELWAGGAHGFAFPSGHATSSTAGYLAFAVLLAARVPTVRARVGLVAVGCGFSFIIGLSRVVLAVHWPTDVIAGWALGTAVAAATVGLTRPRSLASRGPTSHPVQASQ